MGVLARPGDQLRAGLSPAARRFARWRLPQSRGARAALPRAAGLDAGQRADARPLVERAARARGVAAVSGVGAPGGAGRGRGLARGAVRCVRAAPRPSRSRRSSPPRGSAPLTGFALADLDGGAARGAPGRRAAAAGLGGEDRDHALRARRARARPTASAPRSAPPGRSRAACSRATWCWPAAAIRCSTPTRSATWRGALARARARRRSTGGSSSPTGALPAVARDRRRPAGGRRLQPDDLGDEPELQPGVPRLGAGRGRPGAGASARRGERFEVPVARHPGRAGRRRPAAAPLRGRARRSGACRAAASAARAASGCRCARPGRTPARSSARLAAGAGLALPRGGGGGGGAGRGHGGARERRARADAARHAALLHQPDRRGGRAAGQRRRGGRRRTASPPRPRR